MIEIVIRTEYITLGQFLKFAGIISNGGEAKEYIQTHDITVNGEVEKRRGRKLFGGEKLVINAKKYLIVSNKTNQNEN